MTDVTMDAAAQNSDVGVDLRSWRMSQLGMDFLRTPTNSEPRDSIIVQESYSTATAAVPCQVYREEAMTWNQHPP